MKYSEKIGEQVITANIDRSRPFFVQLVTHNFLRLASELGIDLSGTILTSSGPQVGRRCDFHFEYKGVTIPVHQTSARGIVRERLIQGYRFKLDLDTL